MGYASSSAERRRIKREVLHVISRGAPVVDRGRELYLIGRSTVHARFCSQGSGNFKFNINPNTLRSDFELWICGSPERYYLMPNSVIQKMYLHPDAYPDRHHEEIRVVSVDADAHLVTYAARSISLNLRPYFRLVLEDRGDPDDKK